MKTSQLLKILRKAKLDVAPFLSRACVSVQGPASCLAGLDVPEPERLYLSRGEVVFIWPEALVTRDCRPVSSREQKVALSIALGTDKTSPPLEEFKTAIKKAVLATLAAHGLQPHEKSPVSVFIEQDGGAMSLDVQVRGLVRF